MAKFHELDITKRGILLKKVLKYMHKRSRPVMIGEVAVELRESLDLIEDTLDELSHGDDRQVERVPSGDPALRMLGEGIPLYRLCAQSSLKIAHMDLDTNPPDSFKSRPPGVK